MTRSHKRLADPPRSPNPVDSAQRNYKLPKCFFVLLTLQAQSEEGLFKHTTFATGASEKQAVSHWKAAYPAMACHLVATELVTPKPGARIAYKEEMPRGRRISVEDRELVRAGLAEAKI